MTDAQRMITLERIVAALMGTHERSIEVGLMVAQAKRDHGHEWVAAMRLLIGGEDNG